MKLAEIKLSLLFLILYLNIESYALPPESILSLVATSTITSKNEEVDKEGQVQPAVPKITQMHIKSSISNRFAYTTITSKVKNAANKAQEATFSVVLPETAFISKFIMEMDGQNYTAYVKEKEEARKVYDKAVASGVGAAHVAVSARDSNRFTVSVNIESEKKAAFYLTYEQLLKREDGRYEQVININPGQFVKDLSVEVTISEQRKLTDLKAPPLRSGNEIVNENSELDPRADIEVVNETSAVVRFSPNLERQKQLATLLKSEPKYGFSGQFVVQYDVERDPTGGEVLVQDGYFVHFFAPTELEPLPKHIVFVLDTSGSMYDNKIKQLKEAMVKILKHLNPKDLFHLVEFNSYARVHDLQNPSNEVWFRTDATGKISDNSTFPNAFLANQDNIKKAQDTVSKFDADGGTDIITALRAGLHLTNLAKKNNVDEINRQPIILFLTDGEANGGDTTDQIIAKISELNTGSRKTSIFSLSFGSGADKKFLQKLSLRNYGFPKHIYEAADASLQLQDFYRQISSPLLADVKFKYEPSVTSLTNTEFPIHFRGSEIVIAGWCGTDIPDSPEVDGIGSTGRLFLKPTVKRAISNTERLWAYLTVQQLLETIESSDQGKEELKKKALDLALKYSFVTPLTSLVVVKPNDTSAVDAVEASKFPQDFDNFESSDKILGGLANSYAEEEFDEYGPIDFRIEEEFSTLMPSLPPAEETLLENLLVQLPWLKYILNENKFVKLSSGPYKLGLNETITDYEACPKSEAGRCVLLKDCPELYPILITLDDYIQRTCIVKNEYAGVCCPSS